MSRPLLLLLAVCATSLLAFPASSIAGIGIDGNAVGMPPDVSVQGSQLLRDGVPWIPRGVQIVGLVAPDGSLSGKYADAHAHFGAQELRQAVADGADLVRYQVSQFGLDPANSLYSRAYVSSIQSAVGMARSLGLAVILSVQAEPPAGAPLAYRSFIQRVSAQAAAANPGIELVAGLITNLLGRRQTSKTLLNAALATRTILAGFGLNDPGPPQTGVRHTVWYPNVAAAFLRGLRKQGG